MIRYSVWLALKAGRSVMTRALLLGTLVVVGGLSFVVSGQAPAGPSAKAIAATKIEKVKDNLYIVTGSGAADMEAFSGGNTAVFITDAGVTLVDTKLPGWGPTILERVKSVTNKPITRVINTHTHSDHTGSNEFFRSEEHTSELQSLAYLVCRLLLEKKKKKKNTGPARKSNPTRTRGGACCISAARRRISMSAGCGSPASAGARLATAVSTRERAAAL